MLLTYEQWITGVWFWHACTTPIYQYFSYLTILGLNALLPRWGGGSGFGEPITPVANRRMGRPRWLEMIYLALLNQFKLKHLNGE